MATPIERTTRYINQGTTVCLFVPDISDPSSPTRTELDAGTDLSREIAEIEGWMVAAENVDTPDLASRFTSTIPGRTNAEDSTISFYASSDTEDVRTLLPRDTEGFVVWMDGGDVDGQAMDVYPVRVSSVGKTRTIGDEAARITISFAITAEPDEDVDIPTAE